MARAILTLPPNRTRKSTVTEATTHIPVVPLQTTTAVIPFQSQGGNVNSSSSYSSVAPTTPPPDKDLKDLMMTGAQSQVSFKVLAPYVACLVTPDQLQEAIDANYGEIYIMANGTLYRQMNLVGGRHVRLKIDSLPAKYRDVVKDFQVPAIIKDELNFLPDGKIPFAYWHQIVEFFRQVMKMKKADYEAHAWILWEKEKGYYISVPKQTVSKASVSFTYDNEALPPGAVIVVDIHSHNTMGAFYSGTDDNNDRNGIYYSGVVGRITDTTYEWVMRFNLQETKKVQVPLEEIFQTAPTASIPEDWLNQVEVPTTPSYSGYRGGNFGQYVGKNQGSGQSGGVGTTPSNPAKWSASQQQQGHLNGKGGAGNGQNPFPTGHGMSGITDLYDYGDGGYPDFATLWDGLGSDADTFVPESTVQENRGEASGRKNVEQSESPSKTVNAAERREQMEALLRGAPDSSTETLEEMDQRVTKWLESKGYDADGNQIDDVNNGDTTFAKMTNVVEIPSDDIEGDLDPVGPDDFEPHSEMFEEIKASHGVEAAKAHDLIDDFLTALESCDKALMDIAKQCYGLMTEAGRANLETNGF